MAAGAVTTAPAPRSTNRGVLKVHAIRPWKICDRAFSAVIVVEGVLQRARKL